MEYSSAPNPKPAANPQPIWRSAETLGYLINLLPLIFSLSAISHLTGFIILPDIVQMNQPVLPLQNRKLWSWRAYFDKTTQSLLGFLL
jgi:hypothetical protein